MLGKHFTIEPCAQQDNSLGNRAHYSHSIREVGTEGLWRGQVTGGCRVGSESLGIALSSVTLTSHFPQLVRDEVRHLSLPLCP